MAVDPMIRAALEAAVLATIPNSAAAGIKPSRTELAKQAAATAAFLRALDRAAAAERMRERDCHPDDGWNQILSLLVEDAVRHG